MFRNIETSAIVINETSAGVTSNTITAVGNQFEGIIGDYFFNFTNGNTTLAAGSTGNVDATTFRNGLCIRDIFTTITGAADFGAGGIVSQPTCFIPEQDRDIGIAGGKVAPGVPDKICPLSRRR